MAILHTIHAPGKRLQGRWLLPGALLLVSSAMLLLSGCGATSTANMLAGSAAATEGETTTSSGSATLKGIVKGGNPPVTGATVTLYAASTSGYGGASTSLATTTTDLSGNFNITLPNSSACTANEQLYIVATGGNPGLGGSTTNPNLSLMAALGTCSTVVAGTPSFFNVNEVTTIASVYALSGFMADYAHVGTSATNTTGLNNAFATVNNLVNISTGTALTITPAYASNKVPQYNTSIVPQARINALANILAGCVNTSGTTGGSDTTSACGKLFTATTVNAVKPSDTVKAALNIALHPGTNATTLGNLISADSFFQPTLTTSPGDWALAIVYQGAGLTSGGSNPPVATGLAIDSQGNVWVPNQFPVPSPAITSTIEYGTGWNGSIATGGGSVAVFNNLGAPMSWSPSATSSAKGGATVGGIFEPASIAIDQNDHAWIGNYAAASGGTLGTEGSLTVLSNTGTVLNSSPIVPSAAALLLPSANGIAFDSGNNAWVASNVGPQQFATHSAGGTIQQFDNTGAPTGESVDNAGDGQTHTGNDTFPTWVAIDQNNNILFLDVNNNNYEYGVTEWSLAGSTPTYANQDYSTFPDSPNMAIDSTGYGWFNSNFSLLPSSGVGYYTPSSIANGGPPTILTLGAGVLPENAPVVVDGASQIWTTDQLSVASRLPTLIAYNQGGTLLSPAAGYQGWDVADFGSIYTVPVASLSAIVGNVPAGFAGGIAADNSGNLWVAGQQYTTSSSFGIGSGSQLTEFIGLAAPTTTPLAKALINAGGPGVKP